jgi:uncharacterized integral membrane protein
MQGNTGIKLAVALVLMILFTLFVLQNTEIVEIKLLLWKLSISRVLLLVGSLAVGCLIGLLIGLGMFGKKKQK